MFGFVQSLYEWVFGATEQPAGEGVGAQANADAPGVGMYESVFYSFEKMGVVAALAAHPLPLKLPSTLDQQITQLSKIATLVKNYMTILATPVGEAKPAGAEALVDDTLQDDLALMEQLETKIKGAKSTDDLRSIIVDLYALVNYYQAYELFVELNATASPWYLTMLHADAAFYTDFVAAYLGEAAKEFSVDTSPEQLPSGKVALEEHSDRNLRLLAVMMIEALSHRLLPEQSQTKALGTICAILQASVKVDPSEPSVDDNHTYTHYPPFNPKSPLDPDASPLNSLLHQFDLKLKSAASPAEKVKVIDDTAQAASKILKTKPSMSA